VLANLFAMSKATPLVVASSIRLFMSEVCLSVLFVILKASKDDVTNLLKGKKDFKYLLFQRSQNSEA